MIQDTRREPRSPLTAKMRVRIDPAMGESVQLSKEELEVSLLDISASGAGVMSRLFLPAGALVELRMNRADLAVPEGPPAQGTILLVGQIVYAKPHGTDCRIGIFFTRIDGPDRELIRRYVDFQQGRKKSPPSAP